MISMESVILVDEHDNEVGIEEKLNAHLFGKLHRAVSVFLFNEKRQLLIQQRAYSKYHSGGLWSNTCCGHPRPEESPLQASQRRLWEEMGVRCELEKLFHFVYKAALDNKMTEYEFDHVFVGWFDGEAKPNPDEACAWKWMKISMLEKEIFLYPERYTFWFKQIWQRVVSDTIRKK
jgi:isopentenyl-diphosphate Delta-isomerase